VSSASWAAPESLSYWDFPRRGANFFNVVETNERLRSAAAQGIRVIRLVPDKWQGEKRDFLIGDADSFEGLVKADVDRLRAVLDQAEAANLRVILCMLSLPGARWRQANAGESDFRLYTEEGYLEAAAAFWTALAKTFAEHRAIVAYDLLNEPHPERARVPLLHDLNEVYRTLVAAIRTVDIATPIIVESGNFAGPDAFELLQPIDDDKVLYSFHFYEPWEYVNHRNNGRWTYPGMIPGADPDLVEHVEARTLEKYIAPVIRWQVEHAMPSKRIFCGEFGCPRSNVGAAVWLTDVIRMLDEHRWHWAFYAYREDRWPVMDYELGVYPVPAGYWAAVDKGLTPQVTRKPGPLWDPIVRSIRAANPEEGKRRTAWGSAERD